MTTTLRDSQKVNSSYEQSNAIPSTKGSRNMNMIEEAKGTTRKEDDVGKKNRDKVVMSKKT